METAKDMIKSEFDLYKAIGRENFMAKFLLLKGEEFEPAPFHGRRMEKHMCFMNSLHYAQLNDLDYIEGMMFIPGLPISIHHAWCAEKGSNRVIDPTVESPETHLYFGVRFDLDTATSHAIDTGYYGILTSGPAGLINIDLFREYFPGQFDLPK